MFWSKNHGSIEFNRKSGPLLREAYFLFASTEWTFHSGRNEMVHFIPAAMEQFIPAGMKWSGMKWTIPFRPEWTCSLRSEWNGSFHSGRNEMIHFILAGIDLFTLAGIEWPISFRSEWIGPFHSGLKEMAILWTQIRNILPFWFHLFPTVIRLFVLLHCSVK